MPGTGQKNSWHGVVPMMQMAGLALYEDGNVSVATGDYAVQIIETEPWVKKNAAAGTSPSSIIVRAKIVEEGSEKGKIVSSWPGTTPNEGSARSFKAILVSVGADPRAVEGSVQPVPEMFTGKIGYVHVEAPPAAEAGKDAENVEVIWLRKETYTARKAAGGSTAGANIGSTPQMNAPPPMQAFQGFGGQPSGAAPQMQSQGQPMPGQQYQQPQAQPQYQQPTPAMQSFQPPTGQQPNPGFLPPPNGAPPSGGMNLFQPPR